MKKLVILLVSLLACCSFTASLAGDLAPKNNNYPYSYLTPSKSTELTRDYFNPINQNPSFAFQDSLTKEQQLSRLPGYKLPKRALVFSALIPGAGELYAKSYIKAATFFLVEVGAWTFYGMYTKKGNDKEDEYQAFATEKWDQDKWKSWYESAPQELKDRFTHAKNMAELITNQKKTQQYYEMIGKYSEFVVGWEGVPRDLEYDFDKIIDYRKNNCEIADGYMKDRAKTNDLFSTARTGTTIAMLNHLLSAIDAAWTAKRHNNQLVNTSLRFEQIYYVDHLQPVLSLKIQW